MVYLHEHLLAQYHSKQLEWRHRGITLLLLEPQGTSLTPKKYSLPPQPSELFSSSYQLNIVKLIAGDFAAAVALITFGALLGKTTPLQTLFIALSEMIFYSLKHLCHQVRRGG